MCYGFSAILRDCVQLKSFSEEEAGDLGSARSVPGVGKPLHGVA